MFDMVAALLLRLCLVMMSATMVMAAVGIVLFGYIKLGIIGGVIAAFPAAIPLAMSILVAQLAREES